MKKLNGLLLVAANLVIIAASAPSFAGNRPGALTITVGPGYEYFASKRQMQNTGLGFVAVGYDFTRNWGIEGLLAFMRTDFDDSLHDYRKIRGSLFQADAVYHYPLTDVFEPYTFAGFGFTHLNPNRNEAVNEGNINAGLGLQLFMYKDLSLRFEGRDIYVVNGGKNDVMLSAGLSALFDLC
jgi:OOP family OmpA-OmpF porin